MTEPVEIPREAIEAAKDLLHEHTNRCAGADTCESWTLGRMILEAALPFLPGREPQAADADPNPKLKELADLSIDPDSMDRDSEVPLSMSGEEIDQLRATLAEREREAGHLRVELTLADRQHDEAKARLAECVEALREILKYADGALGMGEHLPNCEPGDHDRMCSCGLDAIESGRFEQALESARSALTNLPHTTESVHRETDG